MHTYVHNITIKHLICHVYIICTVYINTYVCMYMIHTLHTVYIHTVRLYLESMQNMSISCSMYDTVYKVNTYSVVHTYHIIH
jgi:hypothetical protein